MTKLKLASITQCLIFSLFALYGTSLHAQKRQTVRWHKIETKNEPVARKGISNAVGIEKLAISIQLDALAEQLKTICRLDEVESAEFNQIIKAELAIWQEVRTDKIASIVQEAVQKGSPHASVDSAETASIDLLGNWIDVFRNHFGFEKQALIDAWINDRIAYQRKSAVQTFLVDLDRRMFLSPDQFSKLEPVIDQIAGKQLYWIQQTQTLHFIRRAINVREGGPKFDLLVNGILSESQLTEWNLTVDHELQNLQSQHVPEKLFGLDW